MKTRYLRVSVSAAAGSFQLDLVDFLINLYEAYSLHSGKNEITLMFLSLKEEVSLFRMHETHLKTCTTQNMHRKKELRYGENK